MTIILGLFLIADFSPPTVAVFANLRAAVCDGEASKKTGTPA